MVKSPTLVVGIGGIATMVGLAYYRSWSKEVDRPRSSRDGPAEAEQGTSSRT